MGEQTRYMRIVPDSHSFGSLDNILVSYEYNPEELTKEYLLVGFKNTLERGWELKKITDNESLPIIFRSIFDITQLIEEDENLSMSMFITIIKNTLESGYDLKSKNKMEKIEVYNRVDGELNYQDKRWVIRRDENGTPDETKPPAEWINYMEFHITEAKKEVYFLNDEEALAQIRKVVALGVRALMIHGCPERVIPEDLLDGE